MLQGIGRTILAVLIWAFICSDCYAQEADTVKTGSTPPVTIDKQDSTALDLMSRVISDTLSVPAPPNSGKDSLANTGSTAKLTRKEQREMRKAAKNQVTDPVAARQQSFRVASGKKLESGLPESLSYGSSGISRDSLPVADAFYLDSLLLARGVDTDSLLMAHGISRDSSVSDSIRYRIFSDTYETLRDSTVMVTLVENGDTLNLLKATVVPDSLLNRRDRRAMQKELDRQDSTLYTHNPYFRDTLSFNKYKLLSMVVPGFGQFYNRDYWKIPVIYGVAGVATYFGIQHNKQYKHYKEIYDYRVSGDFPRSMIDPIQNNMIIHNTARQLLFGAAIGTYIYMVGDGIVNYPSENTRVQTATWLSVICPGAGQVYNKSYWRVPWVAGGFTAFLYVVDWNNRIYQRFKRAFELESDGDPNTKSEFDGTYYGNASVLQTYKDNARRSRDLSLILTGVWYLFNIMDAHVDAHLKVFDVSDSLAWRLEPMIDNFYTHATGNVNVVGFSLSYTF